MPVEEMLAKRPRAIILSGGPKSVYSPDAPGIDASLFSAGVPTFGICYGHQVMASALGGTVARTGTAEDGSTPLRAPPLGATGAGTGAAGYAPPRLRVATPGVLFSELPIEQQVWMSHGDSVTEA